MQIERWEESEVIPNVLSKPATLLHSYSLINLFYKDLKYITMLPYSLGLYKENTVL